MPPRWSWKRGYLPSSYIFHYHAVIHRALKYAVKMDLISFNPADKVERPKMCIRDRATIVAVKAAVKATIAAVKAIMA